MVSSCAARVSSAKRTGRSATSMLLALQAVGAGVVELRGAAVVQALQLVLELGQASAARPAYSSSGAAYTCAGSVQRRPSNCAHHDEVEVQHVERREQHRERGGGEQQAFQRNSSSAGGRRL